MAFKLLTISFLILLYGRPYHDFYISICYIKMVDEKLQVNYRVFKNDAEVKNFYIIECCNYNFTSFFFA